MFNDINDFLKSIAERNLKNKKIKSIELKSKEESAFWLAVVSLYDDKPYIIIVNRKNYKYRIFPAAKFSSVIEMMSNEEGDEILKLLNEMGE